MGGKYGNVCLYIMTSVHFHWLIYLHWIWLDVLLLNDIFLMRVFRVHDFVVVVVVAVVTYLLCIYIVIYMLLIFIKLRIFGSHFDCMKVVGSVLCLWYWLLNFFCCFVLLRSFLNTILFVIPIRFCFVCRFCFNDLTTLCSFIHLFTFLCVKLLVRVLNKLCIWFCLVYYM